jgi:hypothetical protein
LFETRNRRQVSQRSSHSKLDVPLPQGVKPKGDKLLRMEAQCARFESGQVHLPREAPWLAEFCTKFWPSPTAIMMILTEQDAARTLCPVLRNEKAIEFAPDDL